LARGKGTDTEGERRGRLTEKRNKGPETRILSVNNCTIRIGGAILTAREKAHADEPHTKERKFQGRNVMTRTGGEAVQPCHANAGR